MRAVLSALEAAARGDHRAAEEEIDIPTTRLREAGAHPIDIDVNALEVRGDADVHDAAVNDRGIGASGCGEDEPRCQQAEDGSGFHERRVKGDQGANSTRTRK
jgi:hypothetical protein